jgi:hypothetical protein
MKKFSIISSVLLSTFFGLILVFSSCVKEESERKGFVTFGANYHIINCISTVTISVDGKIIGDLKNPTDTISDCGEKENITEGVSIGEHTYNINIRSESGTGCTENIAGRFTISENECEKIFIDYLEIFNNQSDCDKDVLISPEEYENAPNYDFSMINMVIIGDCLKIKFGASGCDGNSWIVKLIDSGNVAESYPSQRTLRLSLENKEICAAYIGKEISFNIKDLQIEGNDKVVLNISGEELIYEY